MDKIENTLKTMEKEHKISILFAAEVGSRVWGYATDNSDFDVKFIYKQSLTTYVNITEPTSVINDNMDPKIEYHGWDLLKACKLLLKSNPSLFEWLFSPTIYMENTPAISMLKNIIQQSYSFKRLGYHYLSLLKSDRQKNSYTIKDIIQMLRATLMTKWLVEQKSLPPLKMDVLITKLITDKEILKLAFQLLTRENAVTWDHLVHYIVEQEAILKEQVLLLPDKRTDYDKVNEIIWQELKIMP